VKIAILSCFYPYRGGIAQFNANLFNELGKSHDVKAFNFTRQYPNLLFPGKTQYVTNNDNAIEIESTPILDSINPISYIKTAQEIKKWDPDLLIMRYWISFFAPSQGVVARMVSKKCTVISILDNVIPHEPKFFDSIFTKFYLKSNHGFIVMSESVSKELIQLHPKSKYLLSPHPVYNHFGDKVSKEDALNNLKIEGDKKVILFFGLIREYKGLDILIEAFNNLDSSYRLIIAGESYGSFEKYSNLIEKNINRERISVFNNYIPDSQVPYLFCASDVVILPYRSATQSGITAIAQHFEKPVITTDVGGLKESIEKTGIGIVVPKADSNLLAIAIKDFFATNKAIELKSKITEINRIYSWSNFAQKIIELYKSLNICKQ
jgi:glycosyltransferase involved in cell wall biosynthesis